MIYNRTLVFLAFLLVGLASNQLFGQVSVSSSSQDIKVVGAMRNVMWKGELNGTIYLDSISNRASLLGLGPISYLTGELLIVDGNCYASKVLTDSTMFVERSFDYSAPFFVYANVNQWEEI